MWNTDFDFVLVTSGRTLSFTVKDYDLVDADDVSAYIYIYIYRRKRERQKERREGERARERRKGERTREPEKVREEKRKYTKEAGKMRTNYTCKPSST